MKEESERLLQQAREIDERERLADERAKAAEEAMRRAQEEARRAESLGLAQRDEEAGRLAQLQRELDERQRLVDERHRLADEKHSAAAEATRKAEEEARRLEEQARLQRENEAKIRKEIERIERHRKAIAQMIAASARVKTIGKKWQQVSKVTAFHGQWHLNYQAHAKSIVELLEQWDHKDIYEVVHGIFQEVDQDKTGTLTWNNSEIRHFINLVFVKYGFPAPVMEDTKWYQLYRKFDADSTYSLDFEECRSFAKFLFTEVESSAPAKKYDLVEEYKSIDPKVSDFLSKAMTQQKQQAVLEAFQTCDVDGSGMLTWDRGEVQAFIRTSFPSLNLILPSLPERVWYQLFCEINIDGNYAMSTDEAIGFLQHTYKRLLDLYPEHEERVALFTSKISPTRPRAPRNESTPASNLASRAEAEGGLPDFARLGLPASGQSAANIHIPAANFGAMHRMGPSADSALVANAVMHAQLPQSVNSSAGARYVRAAA